MSLNPKLKKMINSKELREKLIKIGIAFMTVISALKIIFKINVLIVFVFGWLPQWFRYILTFIVLVLFAFFGWKLYIYCRNNIVL